MNNSLEWAHIYESAHVTTAAQVYHADPDDSRLADQYASWNTALFAGDGVAIYADSPAQLLTWLNKQVAAVSSIIAKQHEDTSVYFVRTSEPPTAPTFDTFTDESQAIWHYLALADNRTDDLTTRIDLLSVDPSDHLTIATTSTDEPPSAEEHTSTCTPSSPPAPLNNPLAQGNRPTMRVLGYNVDPVDVSAGLAALTTLGWEQATSPHTHMLIEYCLQRWARGEEKAAQRAAIGQGETDPDLKNAAIDLTSWTIVIATAISTAQAAQL